MIPLPIQIAWSVYRKLPLVSQLSFAAKAYSEMVRLALKGYGCLPEITKKRNDNLYIAKDGNESTLKALADPSKHELRNILAPREVYLITPELSQIPVKGLGSKRAIEPKAALLSGLIAANAIAAVSLMQCNANREENVGALEGITMCTSALGREILSTATLGWASFGIFAYSYIYPQIDKVIQIVIPFNFKKIRSFFCKIHYNKMALFLEKKVVNLEKKIKKLEKTEDPNLEKVRKELTDLQELAARIERNIPLIEWGLQTQIHLPKNNTVLVCFKKKLASINSKEEKAPKNWRSKFSKWIFSSKADPKKPPC